MDTSTLAPPHTTTITVHAIHPGHYVFHRGEAREGFRKVVRVEPYRGPDGSPRWITVTYGGGGWERRRRYVATEVWAAGPRPRY